MKKLRLILVMLIALMPVYAFAIETEIPAVEYDISQWERLFGEIPEAYRRLFGNNIREIIDKYKAGGGSISLDELKRVFEAEAKDAMAGMGSVIGAALLCAAAEIIVGDDKKAVGEMMIYCMSGICVCAITAPLCKGFFEAKQASEGIARVTEATAPVMITLISACGGASAAAAYPGVILLCSSITEAFQNMLLPLTLVMCGLYMGGSITGQKQLGAMAKLIKSFLKWGMGLAFTLFLGSVSIKGINAAGIDGADIKALKYAFDKSLPIVGGMVSGTYESLRAGAAVLKNGAGTAALILMLLTVMAPAVKLLVEVAALRMLGWVCSLGEGRIASMLDGAAESCTYMFAVTAVTALMNMLSLWAALLSSGV